MYAVVWRVCIIWYSSAHLTHGYASLMVTVRSGRRNRQRRPRQELKYLYAGWEDDLEGDIDEVG